MKMKKLIFGGALLVLVSCAKTEFSPNLVGEKQNISQISEMAFLVFDSEVSFREEINRGGLTQTKGVNNSGLISLFDLMSAIDVENDPVISYEGMRRGIKDTDVDMSLYDLLGYDELVPNESFASLLNARGEFCVGDTMYKISPRGTYYFPISKKEDFEQDYAYYEECDGILCAENTYEMAPSVYRYDTFKDSHITFLDMNCESELVEIGVATKADPTFPSFSWSSFPTYSGSVDDCFHNQVFTYSLPNNRRVRSCVYHHDYVVYDERGSTLKCQKNGFFGWTAVTSSALMMTWKNIIMQGGHGSELPPPVGVPPTVRRETVSYMGKTETCVTITGYVLPDNQLNNVVVGGVATLRSIILNATGIDINDGRIVELVGHDYVQTVFAGSWSVSDVNIKELKMALDEHTMGKAAQPVGGQFWYQALDDNNNLGALRVGTAF